MNWRQSITRMLVTRICRPLRDGPVNEDQTFYSAAMNVAARDVSLPPVAELHVRRYYPIQRNRLTRTLVLHSSQVSAMLIREESEDYLGMMASSDGCYQARCPVTGALPCCPRSS